MAEMLFYLVAAHALADYPLQGDFLSKAKDRRTDIGKLFWPHALFAHSMIHGGAVAIITGSVGLGVAEVVAHAVTDWLKCEHRIGLHTDQAIHLLCKVAWAAIALHGAKL